MTLRVAVTVMVCTIPGREALLERALRSVGTQTRQPDAVVVYTDVGRRGAGPARDAALAMVTTPYVAPLDDDDELLPDHLERLAEVAEATGADVVYPWMVVDPANADNLRCAGPERRLVTPLGCEFSEAMRAQLVTGNNFLHLTALLRTDAIREAGGFIATGPRGSQEDAGIFQALAAGGASFVHVPARTWVWHRGSQGTGGRGAKP